MIKKELLRVQQRPDDVFESLTPAVHGIPLLVAALVHALLKMRFSGLKFFRFRVTGESPPV